MGSKIKSFLRDGTLYYEGEDGFTIPAIMGGDEEGGQSTSELVQGALAKANETSQEGTDSAPITGQGSEGNASEGETEEGSEYSLAEGFLKDIPDEHRPVVEQYVKKWDAGVTRRFQDLHAKYQPYEQLGEVDQLQNALQIYKLIEQNPQYVYQVLSQQFGGQPQTQTQQSGNAQEGLEDELEGLPPQFLEQFNALQGRAAQQEKLLEQVAQFIVNQQKTEQQREQDAQLDQYLSLLEQEFGEFDNDFVLAKMASGVSGADAVKAYKTSVQSALANVQQQTQKVPPILSGGGNAPTQEPVDPGKMASKDVKSLVASLVKHSQGD